MGTHCRVVTDDADLARRAVDVVSELEERWSRFRPASEVSELNRAGGRLCVVSELTFELVARAEQARVATNGAFNPLMLEQLERLGYDRTWAQVAAVTDDPASITRPATNQPIELFADVRAVRLPAGCRFDPGGIGKGLAGDLVAAALLADGASAVQVELGGDVRVAGRPWGGQSWQVHVDDHDHGAEHAATISLPAGGVATSSVVRRRWRRGGTSVHHLIDPATGRSAQTDLDAVTCVAPTLWWAEVVAKVALAAGSTGAAEVFDRFGTSGVLVAPAGDQRYVVIDGKQVAA
ncbi:MAG TPA: FAD:protein FMN transferase [Ilumatobacteraceae bacterium]|nr:FAD:protein FMN transferase [Ilumatobacteraceae bacterium]